MQLIEIFWRSFLETADWTWRSIKGEVPWYTNYFWGLILISIIVWILEIIWPWRKSQSIFRKDFGLDAFYMFFNFFIFSIAISGFYNLISHVFISLGFIPTQLSIIKINDWPAILQLLVFFLVLDFVQWTTHILLHRFPFLWQFHKVHHSVEEMGFATHLRYHWMENILYKPFKTLAVIFLGGFEPEQAYFVHFLAITIGHLNHSNIKITWGPFKYILNNPVMHLWHHAKDIPKSYPHGVNFGISLAIWDYIFRTNYIPKIDGNIPLGFQDSQNFPSTFWEQFLYGFRKSDK